MNIPTTVWIWVPVFCLSVGICASMALVITSRHIKPTKVEEHPYQASAHYDDDKERRAAFIHAQVQLLHHIHQHDVILSLETPSHSSISGPAQLTLWRPDDATLDFSLTWIDPTQPMTVPLPRSGRWRIHVELPPAAEWPHGASTDILIDSFQSP